MVHGASGAAREEAQISQKCRKGSNLHETLKNIKWHASPSTVRHLVRAERFVRPPSVQRMHVATEAVIFAQRTSAPLTIVAVSGRRARAA